MRGLSSYLPSIEKDIAETHCDESEEAPDDNRDEHQAGVLQREVIHGAKRIRNRCKKTEQGPKLGRNV